MICSYCQREYGTISLLDRPIFRTFDHLVPKLRRERKANGKKKDRAGIGSHGVRNSPEGLAELDNLLECCNECNELKADMSLIEFSARLDLISLIKLHKNPNHYLTKEMVITIKKSIKTILNTEPEPILINIIQ